MFGGIGWKIIAMAKKGAAAALNGLFVWGSGGNHGLGDVSNRISPVQLGTASDWDEIESGNNFTIARKTTGSIWSWGTTNTYGQQGRGNTTVASSPVQIGSGTDWNSVSAGYQQSFAIKSNSTLWAWGRNQYYQLGIGNDYISRSSPVQVGSGSNWSSISSGRFHTLGVTTAGTLWAWGRNNYRQLGIPAATTVNSPIQVTSTSDWSMGAGGMENTFLLKTGGSLWSVGRNNEGQLGLNISISNGRPFLRQVGTSAWSTIAAGFGYGRPHCVGIRTNGTFFRWGNMIYGNNSSPVQIGTDTDWNSVAHGQDHGVAIKATNRLYTFGNGNYGQIGNGVRQNAPGFTAVRVGTGTDWASTGAGRYVSAAIKTGGELFVWGRGLYGILGLGDTVDRSSPVQVGTLTDWSKVYPSMRHTMAIKTDGTLWAWGENNGRFGNSSTTSTSSPVQVGAATDWVQVRVGLGHNAAIRTGGTLWTWGSNANGQLGLGDFTNRSSPVQVGTNTDWSKVFCGRDHTIAIKTDNSIWAIGGPRSYGRMLNGSGDVYFSPMQIGSGTDWESVKCTRDSTLARKTNGTIWSWGRNQYGQLGLSDATNRSSPVQIGSATDWSIIRCGQDSAFARKSNNTVWSWGRNQYGQLGLLDATNRSSPVQIGSGTDWDILGSGFGHTIAKKTTGSLWSWGRNIVGQLGLNIFGSNILIPQEQPGGVTSWSKIALTNRSTFGIKTDGTLWSWGLNTDGLLALGNTVTRSSPVQVGTGTDWAEAAVGTNFSVFLKTGGTLWRSGRAPGGGTPGLVSSPVQVGSATDWSKIAAIGTVSAFLPQLFSWSAVFLIKTDATLWFFGSENNANFISGTGSLVALRAAPVQVGVATDWSKVINGGVGTTSLHALAIKTDGTLWAWGANNYGQLALGDVLARSVPVQIGSATNWNQVSANAITVFAVTTGNSLWAWGRNQYGQMGTSDTTNRSSPVQVGSDTDWSVVKCGFYATIAIKTNGTIWGWGLATEGELGFVGLSSSSSPVQIGTLSDWDKVFNKNSAFGSIGAAIIDPP